MASWAPHGSADLPHSMARGSNWQSLLNCRLMVKELVRPSGVPCIKMSISRYRAAQVHCGSREVFSKEQRSSTVIMYYTKQSPLPT